MIKVETVQIDTDSGFFELESVVQYKFKDKEFTDDEAYKFLVWFTENEIMPIVDKCISVVNDTFNAMDDTTAMGCEIIGKIMVSTGKKRYMIDYKVKDGIILSSNKKKITGIETKRSDTPAYFKKMLENSLDFIFALDEVGLQAHVQKVKKEMTTMSISDIAKPVGANDVTKYRHGKTKDIKSVPMHYRAVNAWNNYVEENNLERMPIIDDGDKIKYLFLKDSFNKFNEDVVAFKNEDDLIQIDPNIKDKIDFPMLFEKAFKKPLSRITDVLGWELEKDVSKTSILFM